MYLTTDPIAPWSLVVIAGVAVVALTLWAYARRLRGVSGRRPWVALGLRLAAVLLYLLAALRPTVVVLQRIQQTASLVVLVDDSTSMAITDERGGQSRWDAARAAVDRAREALKGRPPGLDVKFFGF